MKNKYVSRFDVETRKGAFIQMMYDNVHEITFDVTVDGQVIYTSFDAGDAKQFCIDNRLSTRIIR